MAKNNGTYFSVSTHPQGYNPTPLRNMSTDRLHELADAVEGVLNKRAAEERKNWIMKHYKAYNDATIKGEAYALWDKNETFIVLKVGSGKTKSAMARLAPGDTFNYETGIAVAWARLHNEEIPDFI